MPLPGTVAARYTPTGPSQKAFAFAANALGVGKSGHATKGQPMQPSDEQEVKTPTEARQGKRMGVVWKMLLVGVVLAVIAMIFIGQGTDVPTAN